MLKVECLFTHYPFIVDNLILFSRGSRGLTVVNGFTTANSHLFIGMGAFPFLVLLIIARHAGIVISTVQRLYAV